MFSRPLVSAGTWPASLAPAQPGARCRAFASVAFAIGEDHAVIMREMGHTTPAFTLEVYAQAMARGDDERERLRHLMSGGFGTEMADGPVSAGALTT